MRLLSGSDRQHFYFKSWVWGIKNHDRSTFLSCLAQFILCYRRRIQIARNDIWMGQPLATVLKVLSWKILLHLNRKHHKTGSHQTTYMLLIG